MQTTRKEQIEKAIELLESQIASIKEDLENFDPSDYSAESDYEEMLDGVYGTVEICGMDYSASHALKLVDPVAFHVGFSDWASEREYTEFEEYNDMVAQLGEWEDELSDLESELEDLESEEEGDE